MTTTTRRTKDMVLIALFAATIAICAWISIPTTVPFTMQTFGVFLALGVLGGRRGALAVCVYLLLGAVGAPVFAGGNAGIGALFGSTGGYMLSWLAAAAVMGAMEAALGRKTWVLALAMVLGLALCYALGTVWFMAVYARGAGPVGLWTALGWCVFPFILPDLGKIALALAVWKRLAPFAD